MQSYQCPNCGRIYNYGDISGNVIINCLNCRYPLKRVEEVDKVKHPELNEHKIIGTIKDSTKSVVECPYCHSTDTKKISGLSKAGSVALWGIFAAGKVSKQWHCNSCNSDF